MSFFPSYIQHAVELGLLQETDGKITGVSEESCETILGISRVIEKIQPTTIVKNETTTDQESIILTRVLSSPSGVARELWSQLRISLGVAHDQSVPLSLWSTKTFRAIGNEIDFTFLGERNSELISRKSLLHEYQSLPNSSQGVSFDVFKEAVDRLSNPSSMDAYGDAVSEWGVALDLLRQARVKSIYSETMHSVMQAHRADTKMEKTIEFQQSKLMECLGMLRGSIGQQGNAKTMGEMLIGNSGRPGLIDKVLMAGEVIQPVTTTIPAMDLDMEGGVYPPGTIFNGGRLFTLAARTGVGKTILGVNAAVGLVKGGLKVGFVSAELDEDEIWTRISACATALCNTNYEWSTVGDIKQPESNNRDKVASDLNSALMALQEGGGELLVEAPWGADVDTVITILRSMKAKMPDLRAAVLDHFHCLARHKGAPPNDSSMMEDRAYKLMTAAKELGIDLIVLAQMNRVGMDSLSAKNAPTLDQIRGTDALAHVSHAVWIVRKQQLEQQESNPADTTAKKLEFWHAKIRGRQAYWNGSKIKGLKQNVECSLLTMNYPMSSVKFDETHYQVN
jgi:hypothetical protein